MSSASLCRRVDCDALDLSYAAGPFFAIRLNRLHRGEDARRLLTRRFDLCIICMSMDVSKYKDRKCYSLSYTVVAETFCVQRCSHLSKFEHARLKQ